MAKDKEYMRLYMLRRYKERRQEAFSLLGESCSICGSIKDLEIDHKDRREKSLALNRMWSVSHKRFLAELIKCQILCRRCHQEKSHGETIEVAKELWNSKWAHKRKINR